MVVILICTVFTIGFFASSLVTMGYIPSHATLLSELSVFFLLVYALFNRAKKLERFELHLGWVWILFFLVAVCSIIVNRYFNLKPIFSFRLILRYYVFYLAMINVGITDQEFRKINKFLLFVFLVQLPVIAYKFTIYGVHERTIGTYAARGGGLTTIIPIVLVSYLVAFYVIYKQKLWYLILAFCFIIWGIVGAKAALFFLYPPTFFGLYYLTIIRPRGFNFARDVSMGAVVSVLSISILALLIHAQPRMNKGRDMWGAVDFGYALEFAQEYSTGMKKWDDRFAVGRTATLKLSFNQFLEDGFANFVFGYGPGSFTPSLLSSKSSSDPRIWRIAGSYGISGMIYIWVEYGILGVILICILFLNFGYLCWNWYNEEKSPYWKAFATGSLVFSVYYLFIFITYNKLPITGEVMLPVFYYAMAAMHARISLDTEKSKQRETV
jgi:hypothetical protein